MINFTDKELVRLLSEIYSSIDCSSDDVEPDKKFQKEMKSILKKIEEEMKRRGIA